MTKQPLIAHIVHDYLQQAQQNEFHQMLIDLP